MKTNMEKFPATNPNPVLSVDKEGVVLYSNKASELLLDEWGVGVGEKLPQYVENIVCRVISRNNPEKMEIKVGKRVYLVVFHPLPEQECVYISGFDINYQKKLDQRLLHVLNKKLEASSRELRKLNEALINSESKYWHIVENSNDGIWILDRHDRTVLVNQKVSEMLGYSSYEICGHSPKKFLAPKFRSLVDDRLRKHRQKVEKFNDYQFIRKDGSDLWCIVSTHQLFDDDGKYNGSLGLLIDTTERKKAEETLKESCDFLDDRVKKRTLELEKAYALLKESEERLAEAQKMAHVGNWEWDIATDKVYWSEEMYRIFKRDPQELAPSYNEHICYIHPDDLEYYIKATNTADYENIFGIDYRIVLANGEERTLHLKSEFVFDEKNIPVRIKGTVQDITEHKRAEEKIHHLANIVESSSDAIGTLSLDGIVTSWNKAAEQIYGYSAEEISGKPSSIVAPSHLREETKELSKLIKQEENVHHYETLRIRKDGKNINVSITLSPVLDSQGKLTATSFISRDITEQKKSEEKLRESEEKYRNIVETANEGIVRTNNESVLTYVNKKMVDMLGYTIEEVTGKNIWCFISDEYIPIIKRNLEKKKQGISESGDLKLIHKDGSCLWAHMNSKPFFDPEGKYMGAVSMITDIMRLKEAEKALSEMKNPEKG